MQIDNRQQMNIKLKARLGRCRQYLNALIKILVGAYGLQLFESFCRTCDSRPILLHQYAISLDIHECLCIQNFVLLRTYQGKVNLITSQTLVLLIQIKQTSIMTASIKNIYGSVLLLVLLCKLSSCTPMGFSANQHYTYVGRFNININSYILSNGIYWFKDPMKITIPFGRASIYENIDTASTMEDLEIQHLEQGIDVFINDYKASRASMQLEIETKNANNIAKLKISYIYYPRRNVYEYQFAFVKMDRYFNTTSSTFLQGPVKLVNTTGGVEVIASIKGMRITAPTSQLLTLDINITGLVDASENLYITINCQSCVSGKEQMLRVMILLYNPILINQGTYCRLSIYTKTSFSSSPVILGDVGKQIVGFNTIVVLTAFSVSNASIFKYSTQIKDQTVLFTPDSSFISYSLTYVLSYTYYCDYKSRFFDQITNECWDVCPSPRKPDQYLLICYSKEQLTLGAIVGIVVGSMAVVSIITIISIHLYRNYKKKQMMAKHKTAPREAIFMPSPYLHRQGDVQNEIQQKYCRTPIPHRMEHQRTTQELQDRQMNSFRIKTKGNIGIISSLKSQKKISYPEGYSVSVVECVEHTTDIIQTATRTRSYSGQDRKRHNQSMPAAIHYA